MDLSEADIQPIDLWTPFGVPIIKHIPKSVRATCATHLTSLLQAVVACPSTESNWTALFDWASIVLQPPKRAGKRHPLSSTIRRRISDFTVSRQSLPIAQPYTSRHHTTPSSLLSQAVSAKLEDGNIKAAIRLLNSEEDPAVPSEQTFAQLKMKHPSASKPMADLPHLLSL